MSSARISIVVSGAREHNLKDVTVELPRDSLVVITGLSGLGQVVARLRHDLRRGPAPLRRVAERVRAPVPRADGQAGRRLDRGPVAGDLDRPEDDVAQPAVDGRHGHRDLRLPAPAVGARSASRTATTAAARSRRQSAEQIIDQIMGLEEGTRFMVLAPIVRGRKGEYGKQLEELRAEGFTRVKVDGELRLLEEEIVLDKKYKHDISVVVDRLVMRPDAAQAARRLGRDRGRAGRRHRSRSRRPRDDEPRSRPTPSASPACTAGSRCPSSSRGSFSFNSPHGACPRCTGLGSQMEIDPELVVPDPSLSLGEGAILPWSSGRDELLRADHAGDRRALRDRPRHAVGGPDRGPAGPLPVRHQRRPDLRLLPQPDGAQALVHDELRGDRPQPRAPLQGDRLRLVAREDRGVHVGAAVPGVQGRAAAAGVAGGQGRRHADPRVHGAERAARARVARGARAVRAGPRDRAADPARDRRAAALPRQRRRRLPVDGARVGDAVGRRGAADPAGDADRLVAGRRALHPRRAVDRPAPARQRAADRDARAPARPRQHRARGRARRGHDARGRPPDRHGPGRRRARRPRRRARARPTRSMRGQGFADRPVPVAGRGGSRCRRSGASRRATSRSRARRSTTSRTST